MPPGGAIPIRRAVGFNGKVSATVLTMGIPLPTPIIDSMSFPALTLSMTATTSSLQYRITLTAVFALKTSSLPSVKMTRLRLVIEFIERLSSPLSFCDYLAASFPLSYGGGRMRFTNVCGVFLGAQQFIDDMAFFYFELY